MARRLAIVCAVLAAAAVGDPALAPAAPRLEVGITDDAWLMFGPGTAEQRATQLHDMGAELVRVTLDWRRIESKEGVYDWEREDAALDALRAQGIAPILVLWGTPGWANGGRGANVPPRSAAAFAAFARDAATRYSWVRRWIIWNEPNQRRWLVPASPVLYVTRLLNPAGAAIKSVIPSATIAGGATAPRGGKGGTSPVDFIRGMGRAGARLDAYAHHPHPLSPAESPFTGGCDHCTTISMANLERLLTETRRAFGPRIRIWLTELGYQTNPPDRILGVRFGTQARDVAEAQRRAYLAPRVDVLIQYLVRDEQSTAAWQSGLETVSGRAKPAMQSFTLPLVQVSRRGGTTTVWGQIRPGDGARAYELERLDGGSWERVATARTSGRGFFTRAVRAAHGDRLRLVDPSTGETSPPLVVV
jgi:cellulase (glycosyl hydrolase family 5)